MKPEELKIIAEGMGYEIEEYNNRIYRTKQYCGESWTTNMYFRNAAEYNPLINDTQCMEIIRELLNHKFKIRKVDGVYWCEVIRDLDKYNMVMCHGKTINEAVCKAALEYFK